RGGREACSEGEDRGGHEECCWAGVVLGWGPWRWGLCSSRDVYTSLCVSCGRWGPGFPRRCFWVGLGFFFVFLIHYRVYFFRSRIVCSFWLCCEPVLAPGPCSTP